MGSGIRRHPSAHDVEKHGGQDADRTEERRYPTCEQRGRDQRCGGEERCAGDLLRRDRLPDDPDDHEERRKRAGQGPGPVSTAVARVSVVDVPHRFVTTNLPRKFSTIRMTATSCGGGLRPDFSRSSRATSSPRPVRRPGRALVTPQSKSESPGARVYRIRSSGPRRCAGAAWRSKDFCELTAMRPEQVLLVGVPRAAAFTHLKE